MTIGEFAASVRAHLPYTPNGQQDKLIDALARFCAGHSETGAVFILNGYAGTGKTSLTGALVKALGEAGRQAVLMAPTGRAAKVFSQHSGHVVHTIHRDIYCGPSPDLPGGFGMLRHNQLSDTVFIVDEASMIGDGRDDPEGGASLLHDLVEFVFTPDNNRLILLGDTAQLPPVGSTVSPAMQPDTFKQMGLKVSRATLTDTMRQGRRSGILRNATWLRRAMLADPIPPPMLITEPYDDVAVTDSNDVADTVGCCYRTDGPDQTIIVTRSNRRATAFNLAVRQLILEREEELCKGERLLVAKNNYMWSAKIKELDFIANGDVGIVTDIRGRENRHGLRFADINLRLPHLDADVECKIILDTLTDDSASLSREALESLAMARMAAPEANRPEDSYETRLRRLRRDPYFNALQVKYAYAVTCHKAQGAQWNNVFVDLGGIAPEARGLDFYRWLYTAVTRASRRLFLLNPSDMTDVE